MRLKINDKTFLLLASTAQQEMLAGHTREVVTLTLEATYQEVVNNFVEGATFTIIEDVVSDDGSTTTVEHVHNEYPTPGSVTDHRDGTVTVKMGKASTREQDAIDEAEKAKAAAELLAGKPIASEDEALEVREKVETLYLAADMTPDERIADRNLAPMWKAGNHKADEVYRTSADTIWKCRQAYDNATYPDIKPGSESWYTFNIPFHGTTPETALPFVPPKEAESRYKTGEYMIWTDGTIQKCKRDTSYGPDEDADAWEMAT